MIKLLLLGLLGAAIYYIFVKGEYMNIMGSIMEEKYESEPEEEKQKSKNEICMGSMCVSEAYVKDMVSGMDKTSKKRLMSILLQ